MTVMGLVPFIQLINNELEKQDDMKHVDRSVFGYISIPLLIHLVSDGR